MRKLTLTCAVVPYLLAAVLSVEVLVVRFA
jgi:hypothetical protein